jgi:hypothetical protein
MGWSLWFLRQSLIWDHRSNRWFSMTESSVWLDNQLFAIPAIPLTMSAGLLFGVAIGTVVVSIAGTVDIFSCELQWALLCFLAENIMLQFFGSLYLTIVCTSTCCKLKSLASSRLLHVVKKIVLEWQIAATGAFLIARYLARDRLLQFAKGNKKFLAIDKAIGDDGFRVVTLLRLSPLLPFSLGNYLYGLTSVKLGPYVAGR